MEALQGKEIGGRAIAVKIAVNPVDGDVSDGETKAEEAAEAPAAEAPAPAAAA